MTNYELSDWCFEREMPIKVAALLSIWNPDADELAEWDIKMIDKNTVEINDTVYTIYDDDESFRIIRDSEKAFQEDLESQLEVPDYLKNYIDWDRFWMDNDMQLDEATGETFTSIDFLLETYYYAER